ncbi:hypothetical protein [Chondromyces crocatus]|uniref:Uncharacterized protein n=1 Tax=Chondromyces crocatus TaxID=52 RepID=A0A0K1EI24_CHOCO|nr:hypothetical protein [Chondromyces crocatus]AKT40521.1 uncharacterized protein CMC5_046760 [Chondromyces crocatus]
MQGTKRLGAKKSLVYRAGVLAGALFGLGVATLWGCEPIPPGPVLGPDGGVIGPDGGNPFDAGDPFDSGYEDASDPFEGGSPFDSGGNPFDSGPDPFDAGFFADPSDPEPQPS